MIAWCKCGGKIRRLDLVSAAFDHKLKMTVYDTVLLRKGYATFHCDKCYRRLEQRLRRGKV